MHYVYDEELWVWTSTAGFKGSWKVSWTHTFRHRVDPVPSTGKRKSVHYGGDRCHIMNEIHQYNEEDKQYVRGRRRPLHLLGTYHRW